MIIAIVVVYLLRMHAIAYVAARRIRGNEDFMVAGRRLGPIMLAGMFPRRASEDGSSKTPDRRLGEGGGLP